MSLAAGSLNRKLNVQQKVAAQDAAGQPVDEWTDVFGKNLSCNVGGQTGLGSITAMQGSVATSITRYSFRIRYRTGITAGMRVWYRGRAYDIKSVQMDETKREWTDLVCELGGNDG